jgi:TFIIF-interacting CTD phosphatase-like protein
MPEYNTAQTALPIVDKLDPHHFYIVYQLFRESMRAYNGEVVKVSFKPSSFDNYHRTDLPYSRTYHILIATCQK